MLNFKLLMDTNYSNLDDEIKNMITKIIFKQNINLIKKISEDYNRDLNTLTRKYKLGKYD